jgi:hypothetical protein
VSWQPVSKDSVFYDDAVSCGDSWPDRHRKDRRARIVLVLIANKTKSLSMGDETRRIDDPDDWDETGSGKRHSPIQLRSLFRCCLTTLSCPRLTHYLLPSVNLPNLQFFNIDEKHWDRDISPLKVFIKNQLNHNTGVSSQVQNGFTSPDYAASPATGRTAEYV